MKRIDKKTLEFELGDVMAEIVPSLMKRARTEWPELPEDAKVTYDINNIRGILRLYISVDDYDGPL